MIVFIEKGRLGNQLFQYAALRTICADSERLVLIGFDELRCLFENLEAAFPISSRTPIFRLMIRLRPGVERALRHQSIVGVISEEWTDGRPRIAIEPGLSSLQYCHTSYFQNELCFSDRVPSKLRIRAELSERARARIADTSAQERTRIFVHVRRGDFLHWPFQQSPAALPQEWYHRCMTIMRELYEDPLFLLCSDDQDWVVDRFQLGPDVQLAGGDQFEDFALMSECDAGILSASTYSWWAAYFIRQRRSDARFLAPEFWVGHQKNEWFPPGIETSFIDYLAVEKSS